MGAWLVRAGGRLPAPQSRPPRRQQCAAVLGKLQPHCAAHHGGGGRNGACGVYAVQAGVACRCAGAGRTRHRRLRGERLLELLKILLLRLSVLAGIQFFRRAPLPSVGRRILRVRRGFCCAGSGQAGCLCDALRLTPRRFTAAWCLFVLASVRCWRWWCSGRSRRQKLRHFGGGGQLYTALACVNVKQRIIINLARRSRDR